MKSIPNILSTQKNFFKTQKTKDVSYRLILLKALRLEIISNEQAIYEALKKDFNKSEFESFLSEYGLVISELNLVIKNLKKWAKPKRVTASLLTFPSRDYIYKSPYGNVLIIGPWNYPFLLTMEPLIMAIAAGNTVVLKPSELTTNTSQLISEIISNVFPKQVVISVQGGVPVATELLTQKWDYIFFTGSVAVGKIVAKAAAKHLTPVTLELGGKSPCIVDDTVDLKLTARRVIWGKFLNGGQTCIAADYLIVNDNIKEVFIEILKKEIIRAYGQNPKKSKDFPRIINKQHTKRLAKALDNTHIIFGGEVDIENRYISPTLVDLTNLDCELMNNEIFGPILPILAYKTDIDIENIIRTFEKPLAFYVFSNNKSFIDSTINKFEFGGGVVNDLLIHFGNPKLPFGGVGSSGMGAYHGKHGFDTFSHEKSIVKRGTWIDPPTRYAPYDNKKMTIIRKMFKWFG
ncbi:aldehyde dehydrogenase [Seonamhaeicola aphaedonensis]|uniref:Aldehyde dehydrogenase n=1 Tax=Seonamhaeicola aphaedonensis TaxID=1461338 RepID=A0A3D9HJ46_9FLAO|nr:aldehyde dehydrogenase [Seonamhaeicola aphaedonensis]RED49542.1 aldehyde dehydrogenase (NAD+) [Seonamhaeicola aphaedonensis]